MRNINLADLTISKFYGVVESALNHDHGEFWLSGGRGSTKSTVISLLIVRLIVAFPWANAVVVRRVGNTLRDSVYAQIVWAIETLGLHASSAQRFRLWRSGSSPRMRGTRLLLQLVCLHCGIIPAYAGNTSRLSQGKAAWRDHPRVCGEHSGISSIHSPALGSSPRMRGTHRA